MFHLKLTHLSLPGSGKMAFDDLPKAVDMAFGFTAPGSPIRVYRDEQFSDLAAVVWHDGGVDCYR